MATKRTSLEDEYYRYFREEAQRRREPTLYGDAQAQADEVERRLLLDEIAAQDGWAYCPGCGNALSAGALRANGEWCPACTGSSLQDEFSLRDRGKRGIRRKLIDFFFL